MSPCLLLVFMPYLSILVGEHPIGVVRLGLARKRMRGFDHINPKAA